MAWMMLCIAGVLEVCWAVGLKYTHGFTKLWPSVWTIAAIVVSMYLLSLAAKVIPIGTAYAVWVGIGAAGTAVLGVVILKEPVSVWRAVFLVMLIGAIVGLKVTAGGGK
jgi:quaternary ammonium compound-resistance protein SugE